MRMCRLNSWEEMPELGGCEGGRNNLSTHRADMLPIETWHSESVRLNIEMVSCLTFHELSLQVCPQFPTALWDVSSTSAISDQPEAGRVHRCECQR